jgi:methylmalonyl-CoA mutase
METGYQRGRIQDESLLYETRKHDGTLPIVGVNTFLPPGGAAAEEAVVELQRSTEEEKEGQLARLAAFHDAHTSADPTRHPGGASADAPIMGDREAALARLRDAALAGDNLFAVLMDAVRSCSLGEITHALFEVGGRYRRNV